TELGKAGLEPQQRLEANLELAPEYKAKQQALEQRKQQLAAAGASATELDEGTRQIKELGADLVGNPAANAEGARGMALIAFLDIVVFFGVLLVGFAYLWRRGDLNWVRSVAAEREQPGEAAASETLAAAGTGS